MEGDASLPVESGVLWGTTQSIGMGTSGINLMNHGLKVSREIYKLLKRLMPNTMMYNMPMTADKVRATGPVNSEGSRFAVAVGATSIRQRCHCDLNCWMRGSRTGSCGYARRRYIV